jgi:hypothetical protein
MQQFWCGDELTLTVSPATGMTEVIPEKRNYILNFRGIAAPTEISITCNDSPLNPESSYDAETETLELSPISLEPCDELVVILKGDLLATRDRRPEQLVKFLSHFKMETWEKGAIARDWAQIAAGERSLHRYSHLTEAQIQVLESLM